MIKYRIYQLYGDRLLTIDFAAQFNGIPLRLKPREFRLLYALVSSDEMLTYANLIRWVGGAITEKDIDLYVSSLRRKIGNARIVSAEDGYKYEKPEIFEPTQDVKTVPQLSPRELEILRLLSKGVRQKEIATRLDITVATVKAHLTKVSQKFGVSGGFEAVAEARKYGFV